MFRVAAEQRRCGAELLNGLGPGARAQIVEQVAALTARAGRDPDLDQLVIGEGPLELADDGLREAALAQAHDRFASVGPCPEEGNLGTSKHTSGDPVAEREILARDADAALAAIKRELAAIILFGVIVAPLVMQYLEGVRELAVLAGYGLGAGLWVHTRARGLLLALRQARHRRGRDGT